MNQVPLPAPDGRLSDEELVAYVDGELSAEHRRRIEEVLAHDADARGRLLSLESSWELLSSLPGTRVDDTFVASTVSMIAVREQDRAQEQQTQRPRRQRRRAWLACAAALVAVLIGYLVAPIVWPDPNAQLARDLPVLENLDAYQQIDDFDFLLMLADEDIFGEGDLDGR